MSVAVGIEALDGSGVLLGWESAISSEDGAKDEDSFPKGFVTRGLGIAICGAARAYEALKYGLKVTPPSTDHDLDKWAINTLGQSVRDLAHEHGLVQKKTETFDALFAIRGRLYVFEGGAIWRSKHGYAAIGSGAAWAQGALAVTDGIKRSRVRAAVTASIKHNAQCGGRIYTKWVPNG